VPIFNRVGFVDNYPMVRRFEERSYGLSLVQIDVLLACLVRECCSSGDDD
jgi:hypothetical protein